MDSQLLLLLLLILSAVYLFSRKASTFKVQVPVKESDIGKPVKPLNRAEVKEDEIRVTALYVHPIKSCQGTEVQEARWTASGFQYDRKWCIVNAADHHVMTLRGNGEMVYIHPRIQEDHKSPYGGVLTVDVPFPTGETKRFTLPLNPSPEILETWEYFEDVVMFQRFVMDGYVCQSLNPGEESPSDILSAYMKTPVLLIMKGPEDRKCPVTEAFPTLDANATYPDAYPVHLASEESLESLNRAVNLAAQLGADELPKEVRGITGAWQGKRVEMERFRPNIVLKGAGIPYAEDLWREIEIETTASKNGLSENRSQVITIVDLCYRCLLPNVHPKTGERDAAVPYKVIIKYGNASDIKKPIFGTYAVPEGDGVIRVGDKLRVRKWVEDDDTSL